MSTFQNHIGVNLSSSKLQLVEVIYDGESFILENVDEEYFEEFLNFDEKETKIASIMQNSFNELLLRQPIKSKHISFTLPHDFFRVVQVPFDNTLTHSDLIEQFRWELSLLYPGVAPEELVIQHIPVEDCRKTAPDHSIVVATFRKYLRLFKSFAQQNNLRLSYIDNVHIASDRLLSLDESISDGELILSVYVSGSSVSISFLVNNNPMYFKILHASQPGEIIPMLARELSSIKNPDLDKKFISRAFIAGDNVSDSLLEKASSTFRMPFVRFNPFDKIDTNPKLFDRKFFTERPNSFSSATAIAFRVV